MSLDTVSILDGSTFVVSDRRGDLDATPTENHGLFLERHALPLEMDPHRRRHPPEDAVCRRAGVLQGAVLRGGDDRDHLRRFAPVADARQRQVTVGFTRTHRNQEPRQGGRSTWRSSWRSRPTSRICSRSRTSSAKKGSLYSKVDGGKLTLGYKRDRFVRETVISADKKGELREDGFVFNIKLAPQSEWTVTFDVAARGRRADIEALGKPKKRRTNGHAASGIGPRRQRVRRQRPLPGRVVGAARSTSTSAA